MWLHAVLVVCSSWAALALVDSNGAAHSLRDPLYDGHQGHHQPICRPTSAADVSQPPTPMGLSLADPPDDFQYRTYIVTRETAVYLPAVTAQPPSSPSPPTTGAISYGEAREAPQRAQPAHIRDTLKKLGWVKVVVRWVVKEPSKAGWWVIKNAVIVTIGTLRWMVGVAARMLVLLWDYILVPLFIPFLFPLRLFILVPLTILIRAFQKLRPLLIFLTSASVLGLVLGLAGGFLSWSIGKWIPERSGALTGSDFEQLSMLPEDMGAHGARVTQEAKPRRGMEWAERPASAGLGLGKLGSREDYASASSVDSQSPRQVDFEDPRLAESALFGEPRVGVWPAGRLEGLGPEDSIASGIYESRHADLRRRSRPFNTSPTPARITLFTDSLEAEDRHTKAEEADATSQWCSSPTSERKGSLINTNGTGRRPRLPKKKVTFDDAEHTL